jgi:hypothetical protein
MLAQNTAEHAELDVNDVRSKAIEAAQAFERAKIDAAKANAYLEAKERAKKEAEELASNVPIAMQCKKHILCANGNSDHAGSLPRRAWSELPALVLGQDLHPRFPSSQRLLFNLTRRPRVLPRYS